MKLKPSWAWLLAAVPVAVLVVSLWVVSFAPKAPVYQGKTFYQWATKLQKVQSDYNDPDRGKKLEITSAAIRTMGTNCLPLVMADLRARPTRKDALLNWLTRHAPFLKVFGSYPIATAG